MVGIIGLVLMLAIFMTRMPVAYVMILVGWIGFSTMISAKGGLNLLSRNINTGNQAVTAFVFRQ